MQENTPERPADYNAHRLSLDARERMKTLCAAGRSRSEVNSDLLLSGLIHPGQELSASLLACYRGLDEVKIARAKHLGAVADLSYVERMDQVLALGEMVKELVDTLYPPEPRPGELPKAPITNIFERIRIMRRASDLMVRIGDLVDPKVTKLGADRSRLTPIATTAGTGTGSTGATAARAMDLARTQVDDAAKLLLEGLCGRDASPGTAGAAP